MVSLGLTRLGIKLECTALEADALLPISSHSIRKHRVTNCSIIMMKGLE